MRDFNTAGPVRAAWHYCIPPLDRIDLDGVLELIRGGRYFVLHAPRQTGKTSALLALRDLLNGGGAGEYRCLYANVEPGQAAREDAGAAMGAILKMIALESHGVPGGAAAAEIAESLIPVAQPQSALAEFLVRWSASDTRPVVMMIDEIDALVGDTLVSALRQLRALYPERPERFPLSVILCGVRDVRDYRIHASSENEPVAGGSAFNIKAESLRLGDFTRAEVDALLGQHTTETGQEFAPRAMEAIWEQTRGQPWLVNALARELCFERQRLRLRDRPLTVRDVFEAREALILRRDTHIDQLTDKLREPRVRRVIEPLLSGGDGRHSTRSRASPPGRGCRAPSCASPGARSGASGATPSTPSPVATASPLARSRPASRPSGAGWSRSRAASRWRRGRRQPLPGASSTRATRFWSRRRGRSTWESWTIGRTASWTSSARGRGEAARNLWSNLDRLTGRDEVKFVVADLDDFDWAVGVVRRHRLAERLDEGSLGALLVSPAEAANDCETCVLFSLVDSSCQCPRHHRSLHSRRQLR